MKCASTAHEESIVLRFMFRLWNTSYERIATQYASASCRVAILHYNQKLIYLTEERIEMRNDKLSVQSMDFAVSIVNLVKFLKEKRESIISNQLGRSGTSIGANIREAQYAHGKADFIAKLQIALKEANETGYWLELLYKTNYITENEYRTLDSACTNIRVMLILSINTAKETVK